MAEYTQTPQPPQDMFLPPEIIKLQKIGTFAGEGTPYEPLAHLTQDQIKTIALYKQLHNHLVAGGVEDGIDIIIDYLEEFKHLSPSIDRLGRQEIAGTLKSNPIYSLPQPIEEDETKKPWYQRIIGK